VLKNPAAANSQPTFLRWAVKGLVVAVVVTALASGIAAAAGSTPARQAGTLALNAPGASIFVGITPVRVLDTRAPIGVPAAGPIPPDTTINVSVAGLNGIPATATSVAANVAITADAQEVSFVTVWPTGQPRPNSAVNNATPGFISSSAGIFQIGINRQLSVFNQASPVNVIVDVTGYFLPATPESGLVSVFVDRGSGPTRWATLSGVLGSPAGTTLSGSFRFTCTPAQAPCKISYGAAVISDQSGETVVHPRLLIHKQSDTVDAPITFCEYADGANNNAGLAPIARVPTLVAAEAAMDTPLSMGIGGSLDCGSTQPPSPTGTVTEIWVPAASASDSAFYDVTATFAFSPGFDLPPGD
jgi:hypothetical protein